jgi:hypothetical protein
MTLHFGHDFDGIVHAPPAALRAGEAFVGVSKLLQWLENQLGLSGYPNNTDYLRIELYRQSLGQHLAEINATPLFSAPVFFEKSFAADRFATAESLLAWRDELLLAGWGFAADETAPARLRSLAAVEVLFQKKIGNPEVKVLATGFAERFEQALTALQTQRIPLQKLLLYEPEHLQTPILKRLAVILRQQNVEIEEIQWSATAAAQLRKLRRNPAPGPSPDGGGAADADASAVREAPRIPLPSGPGVGVLRARRDSGLAVQVAQILRENPALKPVFLVPEMNLILEQNLVNEGLAPMGILSASLARPSLQVLKLAPAFLWEPVDVFKIMEFSTLALKPLDAGLALEIARVLAERPGLFSDQWFAAIYGYLEQAEVPDSARKQYEFWFDRRRYPADATAPKRDAVALYAYLQDWAQDFYTESGSNNTSLLVLAEQARRIRELLQALPEQRIGFLDLERIVRTIYEPSPMQMTVAEVGSFAFVHQSGALATPVDTLIWWNCLHENAAPPPNKWQSAERKWLENQGVALETPRQQSQRRQLLQLRPLLQTTHQLLLAIPEYADGAEAVPSLLLGDLEALFGAELKHFTFNLDTPADRARLAEWLALPEETALPPRAAQRLRPQLHIAHPARVAESEYETPTQLESLFYYPHRWFFKQKLRIAPTNLLRVTRDNTLLGNLAHRFFEKLMKENLQRLDRRTLQEWIDAEAATLLPREGATLLLYGREPERNAFLHRVKNAAWSLVSLIRANGWEVAHTELELEGHFGPMPVRGKADLVLRRGDEHAIVDLKWSGAKRRKELIQNGEDLQLVLYGKLLPPAETWPHTAYFILDEGKIVARNAAAFREAVVAGKGGEDHAAACDAIFEKMLRTYAWRIGQIRQGQLEIRTARTASELEALYEGQLFDLLEMKSEDARWDDYRTFFR